MGITNSNKQLSTDNIDCSGTFKVMLSLVAAPDIVTNPTDIVLILDRSESTKGTPLVNLKKGAKKFIDIIDEATDGEKDGNIGSGSRIGIVSFSTQATKDTALITSVDELNNAVNALSADGFTNHAQAFTKAVELFDMSSPNERVIVMFTDGKTTIGANPAPIAEAAKAKGIIIYCIGLSGDSGLDEQALNDWASDPDSSYVAITPDDEDLEELFENLAKNIVKPGATNIVINEKVNSCFKITGISAISKGTANIVNSTTLEWKISELGVVSSEGATLEFAVQHIGPCTGVQEVNASISYSDNEGNTVIFQSPEIDINCSNVIFPEKCPEPIDVQIGGCSDAVEFDAGDLYIQSLGRILQLDVKLKNICPGKRVALAAILTEVDQYGVEYNRGVKTVTIPAHYKTACQDVTVKCLKFVLPEDLDVSGASDSSICNKRNLKAKFIAHYIDADFECCDNIL